MDRPGGHRRPRARRGPAPAHPNGATSLDHVVVTAGGSECEGAVASIGELTSEGADAAAEVRATVVEMVSELGYRVLKAAAAQ